MRMVFIFLVFLSVVMVSNAKAQFSGIFNPDIPVDALSEGDPIKGFGFAALRYEDKQRLKRLRERYLELNPKNRGVVTVYDVEDDGAESDDEAASIGPRGDTQSTAE